MKVNGARQGAMREGRTLRIVLTVLLLSSAALFAVGVAIERHDIKRERAGERVAAAGSPKATASSTAPSVERTGSGSAKHSPESGGASATKQSSEGSGGESAAKHAAEGASGGSAVRSSTGSGGESAAHRRAEGSGSSERVFGINTESTALVLAAVAVSVLLAIALWVAPGVTLLLFAVLGLGIVSAVFDVREAVHQSTEGRGTVEAIAIVVAALHLGAAVVAGTLLRKLPWLRPSVA